MKYLIYFVAIAFALAGITPVRATCPPPLKILSSTPENGTKNADPEAPIVIEWNRTTFELPTGPFDYKPRLRSINIAGGRYGLGTLLTTEWGVGGKVKWDGNKEIITPEKPLEPGTQYRIWTYIYTTGHEVCPPYGGEIIFVTRGDPPKDNNPIRNFDLSTLYHGDKMGAGSIEGKITRIDRKLGLISVKTGFTKELTIILKEDVMVMKGDQMLSPSELKVGDKIKGDFTGGRLYLVTLLE